MKIAAVFLLLSVTLFSCKKKKPTYCWNCYVQLSGQLVETYGVCDKTQDEITSEIQAGTYYSCTKQ